jgi:hypothetical protein
MPYTSWIARNTYAGLVMLKVLYTAIIVVSLVTAPAFAAAVPWLTCVQPVITGRTICQ